MKQYITTVGRVELDHQEITIAILEYLKNHHNYKGSKVVYLPSNERFEGAVVEVKQEYKEEVPQFGKEKQTKIMPQGIVKKNIGVYDTIRALLNETFDKFDKADFISGRKCTMKFDDIYSIVKDLHPGMDERKLYIYLYDQRQLPNVKYVPKERTVYITGNVRHV